MTLCLATFGNYFPRENDVDWFAQDLARKHRSLGGSTAERIEDCHVSRARLLMLAPTSRPRIDIQARWTYSVVVRVSVKADLSDLPDGENTT